MLIGVLFLPTTNWLHKLHQMPTFHLLGCSLLWGRHQVVFGTMHVVTGARTVFLFSEQQRMEALERRANEKAMNKVLMSSLGFRYDDVHACIALRVCVAALYVALALCFRPQGPCTTRGDRTAPIGTRAARCRGGRGSSLRATSEENPSSAPRLVHGACMQKKV